ncbi:MAG: ethanolamine ammonia-lyase reactivating factor EutA [Eubacteriales bacterium]
MRNRNRDELISVGIDIGTTTTQVIISKLTLENLAGRFSVPRVQITQKEILYRSAIHFTPLIEHHLIDAPAVAALLSAEYSKAGFTTGEIDTGAVIITGETAKKENAKAVISQLAGFAGDFVVATAGPKLEAIMAGKGSGAQAYSVKHKKTVINIDVGGGTSNYVVFNNGKVVDTACINVGGHLVELEPLGSRVAYVAPAARKVMRECGLTIEPGQTAAYADLKKITDKMAEAVVAVFAGTPGQGMAGELMMTEDLRRDYILDTVMVSGGVADFVYDQEARALSMEEVSRYGDIGPLLGVSLHKAVLESGLFVARPEETIRATVIGAGSQSLEVSGSTISVVEDLLPLTNIPVVKPFAGLAPADPAKVKTLVERSLEISGFEDTSVALAIAGPADMSFNSLQSLARGLTEGLTREIERGRLIIIVLEQDCAKALGQSIKHLIPGNRSIVCVDQVLVEDGDYIDIGKPIIGGRVVPIIVKTLVFNRPDND